MIAMALALVAAYGMHLLYSALVFRWAGFRPGPARQRPPIDRIGRLMTSIGLDGLAPAALGATTLILGIIGFGVGAVMFAGVLPGMIVGGFFATLPIGVARLRAEQRRAAAQRAWPAVIEEIRLLTASLGRSIPQATFEAGARAPDTLRVAFESAEREWRISTDFGRALEQLKSGLAHNTADVVAETLLIAHELGGGDVGRRLHALAEDRLIDQQHRRDAVARQAGVRYARWFVIIVPIGMAFAGLSIGNGRAAYGTGVGQIFVAVALLIVITCWVWAGWIMRLPREERVLR